MIKIPDNYSPAPQLLKDRVILVTGAGDGIGATAARTFAKFGATVVLAGRTQKKLEAVYDAIVEDGGPEPIIAVGLGILISMFRNRDSVNVDDVSLLRW